MKELKCLRCNGQMEYQGRRKIQLGEFGLIVGNLSNLFSGAMELDVLVCPNCGKVEFFCPIEEKEEPAPYVEEENPQLVCPNCGGAHGVEYSVCPHCNFNYHG